MMMVKRVEKYYMLQYKLKQFSTSNFQIQFSSALTQNILKSTRIQIQKFFRPTNNNLVRVLHFQICNWTMKKAIL